MKIRLNRGQYIAGPDVVNLGGGVFDVSEPQACAIVEAGYAVALESGLSEITTVSSSGRELTSLRAKGRRSRC